MKTRYTVALSLLAGAALVLRQSRDFAHARPPGYVVAEIDVTNQEAFLKEFTPLAVKALADSGNKALARGGKVVAIERTPKKSRIVIYSFPSSCRGCGSL